jgi:hypothetical protein
MTKGAFIVAIALIGGMCFAATPASNLITRFGIAVMFTVFIIASLMVRWDI